jgi:hypothetical protein
MRRPSWLDYKLVAAIIVLLLAGSVVANSARRADQIDQLIGQLDENERALAEQGARNEELLRQFDQFRATTAEERAELLRQQRTLLRKLERVRVVLSTVGGGQIVIIAGEEETSQPPPAPDPDPPKPPPVDPPVIPPLEPPPPTDEGLLCDLIPGLC